MCCPASSTLLWGSPMTEHAGLSISLWERSGLPQISLDTEDGSGYRLGGPKFAGDSVKRARWKLDERDLREIQRMVNAALEIE
jgi:hypothetical protein